MHIQLPMHVQALSSSDIRGSKYWGKIEEYGRKLEWKFGKQGNSFKYKAK